MTIKSLRFLCREAHTDSIKNVRPAIAVQASALTGLEEQDGHLAEVEVDEMLGLVCHVAAEVAADNAVPCWVVLFVEFFLDVRSNVFLNVVLLERLRRTVNGVLLHVLRHIGILDDGLSVSHCCRYNAEIEERQIKPQTSPINV